MDVWGWANWSHVVSGGIAVVQPGSELSINAVRWSSALGSILDMLTRL